jgi:DNA recombination protein RmuC
LLSEQSADRQRVEKATQSAASSEAHLEELRNRLAEVENEKKVAIEAKIKADDARNQFERQAALSAQSVKDMQERINDWEKTKKETIDAVNAAAMESATKLSSKLLDDHKRESKAIKDETEKALKVSTHDLQSKFTSVSEAVATLQSKMQEHGSLVDTVWRALTSPGGAANLAEIGLGNTLTNLGLVQGRDFLLQKQIDGGKLRPDAVVFMPNQSVLVVDSKSSKWIVEMAEAEKLGEKEAEHALSNFVARMNQHLKDLAGKNYQTAIHEAYSEAGKPGKVQRTMSLMYVPSEAALEKLGAADPEFTKKCARANITATGHSGLYCLVAFARSEIDYSLQNENQARIVDETRLLLDRVATVLGHANRIGSGLKTATKAYGEMARSANSRLRSKVGDLKGLGVTTTKNQGFPIKLQTLQVIEGDDPSLIEGEAEELLQLPDANDETNQQ